MYKATEIEKIACGFVSIGMREDIHVNMLPSPKGLVL
jgi:hypothetical protein